MLEDFRDLRAVQDGYLALGSSYGSKPPKSAAKQDIRYVLLSPHDHSGRDRFGLNPLPDDIKEKLKKIDAPTLRAYLESERDAGINELRAQILRTCPGGISVSAEVNRGICNVNRNRNNNEIPNIWLHGDAEIVMPILEGIHEESLQGINAIIKKTIGTRKAVQLVCLHSMDPYGFKKEVRPALDDNLQGYVDAHGLPTDQKIPRKQDFITGERGGRKHANMRVYREMQRAFTADGIEWATNKPYATGAGYPDFRYMYDYPGQVVLIDLTKDALCESVDRNTFDSRNPKPDADKVAQMATYFQRGLAAV